MALTDAVKNFSDGKSLYGDPEETGTTFAANAFIKAAALYDFLGDALRAKQDSDILIVADDSGLCVSALGGAPGVYSARYASENGENATDSDNVEKLLHEMENIPDEKRQAAFVCAVAGILIKPNLPEYILLTAEGNMPVSSCTTPQARESAGCFWKSSRTRTARTEATTVFSEGSPIPRESTSRQYIRTRNTRTAN